ncbi:MAG: M48 family metallopeptidase [Elusimicrobia bacterium]|nr:M48 family metallopeptidase [Elusimicrobiota bacterium]
MTKCMVKKSDIQSVPRSERALSSEVKFERLVSVWSKKIHANPKRIRFQKMTKKWASCSTAGQITFNISLLKKSQKFQEAVIVHELVHLLVPNHGKLFSSMFLSFIPNGNKILNNDAR